MTLCLRLMEPSWENMFDGQQHLNRDGIAETVGLVGFLDHRGFEVDRLARLQGLRSFPLQGDFRLFLRVGVGHRGVLVLEAVDQSVTFNGL